MSDFLLPEPEYIGLPPKFDRWRVGQDKAALRSVGSEKRFVALSCPTGFGKTVAYIAAALLSGQRVCVLTSTKGLQSQVLEDFGPVGLVDIRGQNNYPCLYDGDPENNGGTHQYEMSCEEGPCHSGVKCELQKQGCTYFDALTVARNSKLVVTNYSYWMKQLETVQGLGQFGMLVLDEAHDALDSLSDHLAVELWAHELDRLNVFNQPEEFTEWRALAKNALFVVGQWIEDLSLRVRMGARHRDLLSQIRFLKRLEHKLQRLALAKGEWVFQSRRQGPHAAKVVRFDPVWPGEYSERHLFTGVQRVILTSATVRPKTLSLLGCDPAQVDFVEYPSSFPVDHRPVWWIPTARVDKNATPAHLNAWVAKMDSIIAQRLDRKGIVHCVSFEKANLIYRRSQYANLMLLNQSGTAQSTVDEFRRSKPPRILVSPSISTGYDFPFDQARYQIVAKVPFLDSRDLVLKARTEKDKEYGMYATMQSVVQMAGRGVRSEDDFCETLILDDNWEWFFNRYRKFAPRWFVQAVQKSRTIPQPPKIVSQRA